MENRATNWSTVGAWRHCEPQEWLQIQLSDGGALVVASDGLSGSVAVVTSGDQAATLLAEISRRVEAKRSLTFKVVGDGALVAKISAAIGARTWRIEAAKSLETKADIFVEPRSMVVRVAKAEVRRTRVLIVDDSKTMRRVLANILSQDGSIDVVGECEDPLTVEGAVEKLRPDVVSLDINMPVLDGVALVKRLVPKFRVPIVMVTALSIEQGDQVLTALASGAVDYIQKPSYDEIDGVAQSICQRFRAAGTAKVLVQPAPSHGRVSSQSLAHVDASNGLPIVIGASTGGTEALKRVLSSLPPKVPPILIVQHIPPVFSQAFAQRLAAELPFAVKEARDGDEVLPNQVLIAPGGSHMRCEKRHGRIVVRIEGGPNVSGHKPSVDALFHSVASVLGGDVVAAILTGMGKDGAEGMLKLRSLGARTFGQDEASCVVYGMPAVAKRMGAVEVELSLGDIGPALLESAVRSVPSRRRTS